VVVQLASQPLLSTATRSSPLGMRTGHTCTARGGRAACR
jgi:hypothetical protein